VDVTVDQARGQRRGTEVDHPGGCAHEVADVSVVPDRNDDAVADGDRGRRLG
jgi:hypothetical protein